MATNPINVPAPAFSMDSSTANACATVRCHGKLSADTVALFNNEIRKLISRCTSVAIDLSDVNYMDSSGLGALMGAYASARKEQRDFRILSLSPRIMELLRVTNLASVLTIEGNLL